MPKKIVRKADSLSSNVRSKWELRQNKEDQGRSVIQEVWGNSTRTWALNFWITRRGGSCLIGSKVIDNMHTVNFKCYSKRSPWRKRVSTQIPAGYRASDLTLLILAIRERISRELLLFPPKGHPRSQTNQELLSLSTSILIKVSTNYLSKINLKDWKVLLRLNRKPWRGVFWRTSQKEEKQNLFVMWGYSILELLQKGKVAQSTFKLQKLKKKRWTKLRFKEKIQRKKRGLKFQFLARTSAVQ